MLFSDEGMAAWLDGESLGAAATATILNILEAVHPA
jgi:hypothetical protein